MKRAILQVDNPKSVSKSNFTKAKEITTAWHVLKGKRRGREKEGRTGRRKEWNKH